MSEEKTTNPSTFKGFSTSDPEVDYRQIEAEVNPVVEQADLIVVENSFHYESAAEFLKELKEAQAKVIKFFRGEDGKSGMLPKAHAAWKEIVASENNVLNPLKNAELEIKSKLLQYDAEQERKAREEQKHLQKIADTKAEAEKQRKIKAANELKTEELRNERLEEAEEIEAPIIHVQHDTPKVAGISTRTAWKARILNKKMFIEAATKDSNLLGFITINQTQLDKLAQATKGELNYPGIEFYSSQVMAAGGKK